MSTEELDELEVAFRAKSKAVSVAKGGLDDKRKLRSKREYVEKVGDILIENPGFASVSGTVDDPTCPLETDDDLPGYVIVKKPKPSASIRLRETMWRTDKDGQTAKAKALKALVLDCLVYPHEDVFAELIDRHEFVIERAAKVCERLGEAAKEAAGKG